MSTDLTALALPVTVYAVNVRYNVRDTYKEVVPKDCQVVFILHQFAQPGYKPIHLDEEVLAVAREAIEADTIASSGPTNGMPINMVYEFADNWSYMETVVSPARDNRVSVL